MNRAMIRLSVALTFLIGLVSIAPAHPGHLGTAFHAHSLPEALKLATRESRLVLLYVSEPGGRGWSCLRWPTAQNHGLIDLLMLETVIVECDARRDAAGLAAYDVGATPALLLLDADGAQRRHFAGDISAALLERDLRRELANVESLDRVQAALQALGDEHFFTHERMAAALARTGDLVGAVREYEWCVDRGLRQIDLASVSRRPAVLRRFASLALEKPAIRPAVQRCRERIEQILTAERDDPQLARDLGLLNRTLGDGERSLSFFDQLPRGSRARHGLFDFVFEQLVDAARYAEILELIDPHSAVRGELTWYRRMSVTRPAYAERGNERGTRGFVLARCAGLLESLCGTGADEQALHLIDEIRVFDSNAATKAALLERVRRAGRSDLLRHINNRWDGQVSTYHGGPFRGGSTDAR